MLGQYWPKRVLVLIEAGISGFYIAITRGLAPILLSSAGYGLADIVLLNVVAYSVGVAAVAVLYSYGVLSRLGNKLALVHGIERILWGIIPLTVATGGLVYPIYSLAITTALFSSILLAVYIFSSFPEPHRLMAYRGSLTAASSIAGQVVAVLVLIYGEGFAKYIGLYLLAMLVGIIATIVLWASRPKTSTERASITQTSEAPVVAFVFTLFLLSSTAVIGVLWAPYLMEVLGAPDYLAASLGLAQMATNVFSSLLWAGRKLETYRWAIILSAMVPILIISTPTPTLHIAIAVLYAIGLTGTTMLASRIYAMAARRENPYRAATMLVAATSSAQVLGLATVLALLPMGPWAFFPVSTGYALAALALALLALKPVAIAPPHMVALYSRIVYTTSIAGYSFIVFTVKSYVYLTARLTGAYMALLLLYLLYRIIYYLSHPTTP